MAKKESGGKFPQLLMHAGMRIKKKGKGKKQRKNVRRKTDREEEEKRRKGEGDFPGVPTI